MGQYKSFYTGWRFNLSSVISKVIIMEDKLYRKHLQNSKIHVSIEIESYEHNLHFVYIDGWNGESMVI